ncbi:MAG: hypothetical protein B6D34_07975 [Candidatus Brocadia sp. UTAMX1]|jgi:outer membrane lipoprotein|nr:MAG: hypothetical protein B6D34_07975 [Candidatus Brocadia sp. UTAMX1]
MKKTDKGVARSYGMLIIIFLFMVSCAPVISKQLREKVRPDITFSAVLNDPESYKGQMIVLSGIIIETENTKEGTVLRILQRPAGFRGKPKDVDATGGRFLALDNRYLDVNVYSKGRSVTIAGEILGKRIIPLGQIDYQYPLISVEEIYLWPTEKTYPSRYYYYPQDYWWLRGRYPYY